MNKKGNIQDLLQEQIQLKRLQKCYRLGTYEFDIPFSRQQLADYLAVERSGLSLELGKMQKEGLLEFRKNHFVLRV